MNRQDEENILGKSKVDLSSVLVTISKLLNLPKPGSQESKNSENEKSQTSEEEKAPENVMQIDVENLKAKINFDLGLIKNSNHIK